METRARVVEVGRGRARIECEASESCAACGSKPGCGLRWLQRPGRRLLEVPERSAGHDPLVSGDLVDVSVADGEMLRSVAILYGWPLLGVLAGAALGQGLGPGGEGATAAGGLLGLLAGAVLARGRVRRRPPRVTVERAREQVR